MIKVTKVSIPLVIRSGSTIAGENGWELCFQIIFFLSFFGGGCIEIVGLSDSVSGGKRR